MEELIQAALDMGLSQDEAEQAVEDWDLTENVID